jgi:hypothetical protein
VVPFTVHVEAKYVNPGCPWLTGYARSGSRVYSDNAFGLNIGVNRDTKGIEEAYVLRSGKGAFFSWNNMLPRPCNADYWRTNESVVRVSINGPAVLRICRPTECAQNAPSWLSGRELERTRVSVFHRHYQCDAQLHSPTIKNKFGFVDRGD